MSFPPPPTSNPVYPPLVIVFQIKGRIQLKIEINPQWQSNVQYSFFSKFGHFNPNGNRSIHKGPPRLPERERETDRQTETERKFVGGVGVSDLYLRSHSRTGTTLFPMPLRPMLSIIVNSDHKRIGSPRTRSIHTLVAITVPAF